MKIKISSVKLLLFLFLLLLATDITSAHCDSIEGPVVKASQKALETGNINYVLIWVKKDNEREITNLFDKVLRIRKAGGETKELADTYFFETVVRVHRMGEGEGYTGLKPVGYKPEKGIKEADIAVETNSMTDILAKLDQKHHSKVKELFKTLQTKKNYKVNDIKAGREYVEAYVHFIHFIEELYSGKTNTEADHHNH